MKTLLAFGGIALLAFTAASCIDFDDSQRQFCESLPCQERAQICADGPQIGSQVPSDRATNVELASNVTVTFTQPVGCTDAGITLVQYTTGEPSVAGVANCAGDNKAVFTPASTLLAGRSYKAYLNVCQVWNDAGVGVAATSWTFGTRP